MENLSLLWTLLGWVLLTALVAPMGINRKIGLWWGVFFCFFFSPLIGAIIISFSRKSVDPLYVKDEYAERKRAKLKKGTGFFLVAFGALLFLFSFFIELLIGIYIFSFGIGFIGLGIYLVRRAQEQIGKG